MAEAGLIPFDDRDGLIWFDGKLVPWREAQLHVLSHGLHYASAVFEGERCYSGNIFACTEHSERLRKSAQILGFEVPFTVQELDAAKYETLAANNLKDAYVRPIAWRGSEMMGVSAQLTKIHVAIACWEWPSYFSPEALMKGIRMKTGPWRRPPPESAPVHSKATGLYMICTLSKHWAEEQKIDDAMMLDWRGFVSEGTGANIFLNIDGKLHTPTPDCFLNGITRQTVMRIAREHQIEVVERHIPTEDLAKASECFVTGTAAEVTPVGRIDDNTFTVGEMTQTLMNAYSKLVRSGPAA
ncbi:MAG TPA: branched-chain amino acid aminotransferase [Alphaproteobacteria bacterium]|nr:branched-chain amino acid aminotransferase [Alphaproteobacteria bacterium]